MLASLLDKWSIAYLCS